MGIRTVKTGTLEYLVADGISAPHCFTTRLGGVSKPPVDSLNLGWNRGDTPENVTKNYQILADGTLKYVCDAPVDANGNADSINLMYRPKAGAVSKESTSAATDAATENKESGFDAIKVLILVAAGTFVIVFIVNKVYIKKRMNFIDEL